MMYYRCKCGDRTSMGSMPPPPCEGCEKCGMTMETHPDHHRAPVPHDPYVKMVETDEGPKPITRCRMCLKRLPPQTPPQAGTP